MIQRYEAKILDAIDEVTTQGYAKLSKAMLRKWYGQDRMSKTIWRKFESKLPEDWSAEHIAFFEWEDTIILLDKECLFELEEHI